MAADQRTVSDVFQAGRFDGPGRADLPRHVATQLAEAVQRGAGQDRPIELTLSPAELGRVRISMAPGDGTIIVTVLAARGETLDLMRRHADQLAQEFHDLGYGSAEFSFAQNSGDQGADQGEAAGRAMLPAGMQLRHPMRCRTPFSSAQTVLISDSEKAKNGYSYTSPRFGYSDTVDAYTARV